MGWSKNEFNFNLTLFRGWSVVSSAWWIRHQPVRWVECWPAPTSAQREELIPASWMPHLHLHYLVTSTSNAPRRESADRHALARTMAKGISSPITTMSDRRFHASLPHCFTLCVSGLYSRTSLYPQPLWTSNAREEVDFEILTPDPPYSYCD